MKEFYILSIVFLATLNLFQCVYIIELRKRIKNIEKTTMELLKKHDL